MYEVREAPSFLSIIKLLQAYIRVIQILYVTEGCTIF